MVALNTEEYEDIPGDKAYMFAEVHGLGTAAVVMAAMARLAAAGWTLAEAVAVQGEIEYGLVQHGMTAAAMSLQGYEKQDDSQLARQQFLSHYNALGNAIAMALIEERGE